MGSTSEMSMNEPLVLVMRQGGTVSYFVLYFSQPSHILESSMKKSALYSA